MTHPFNGPFSGAPGIGGNPIDDPGHMEIKCPKCTSSNFRAWTNDYGVQRECLEKECRQVWSGGTMAAARPDMSLGELLPDGSVAPDIDIPSVQYTGAGFRDPSKTFGDDDW